MGLRGTKPQRQTTGFTTLRGASSCSTTARRPRFPSTAEERQPLLLPPCGNSVCPNHGAWHRRGAQILAERIKDQAVSLRRPGPFLPESGAEKGTPTKHPAAGVKADAGKAGPSRGQAATRPCGDALLLRRRPRGREQLGRSCERTEASLGPWTGGAANAPHAQTADSSPKSSRGPNRVAEGSLTHDPEFARTRVLYPMTTRGRVRAQGG